MIKNIFHEDLEQRLQELKQSISTYRKIFNLANDAIFIHNPQDGSIIDANQKALEMYGYTKEEIVQLDIGSISKGIFPYSNAEVKKNILRVARSGNQPFQWKSKKKNGKLFWTEVTLKTTILDNEECIIAIVRDVSPPKHNQDEGQPQTDRSGCTGDGTGVNGGECIVQKGRIKKGTHENHQVETASPPLILENELLSAKLDVSPTPDVQVPDIDLASIIDTTEIQSIINDFWHLTHMVTAVLDLKGNVIVATGWQDICTKFHRLHPQAGRNCKESDLFLSKNLKPGEYVDYLCKNGLWDVVTPLYIGSRHLGNVFTGQFFYVDDEINETFFIQQAEKCGFEKEAYLEALKKAPKYSKDTVDHLMQILVKFTTYVSEISLANTQLETEIKTRKKIERVLTEKETYFHALIDTLPDLIWLKDPEGTYLSCNSKFERFIGAKKENLVGKSDYDFFDVELANFFRKNDKAAMIEDQPRINEEEITYADDGHTEILETIKTPMYSNNGELIGILGVGRDITQRKRNEETIRKEKKNYQAILETIVDGFWLADLHGRILEVNDAYCKMSGYGKDELLSMQIPELEGNMGPGEVASKIDEVVESGFDRFETRHRRKDGSLYDVEVSVQYVSNDNGQLIIFLRDISEIKKAEKDKKDLEAQLIQAQKMESVGRLAGGVAHDYNNMLGVILGYSEMALEHADPSTQLHTALQEIMKAGQRSADITRQLLAFARQQTIAPAVVNLNKLIANMLKMIRRLIGEDIHLSWLPGKDLWKIKIDPSQIDQIIVNLCVNARDAIQGVGKLTIETDTATLDKAYCEHHLGFSPGDYVILAVSDDGCGIQKELLENIFEPFFTTKGMNQGTGLGLATVYGIVKQNGGFLNVYSEPEIGTTFKIYFPRSVQVERQTMDKDTAKVDRDGSETILLVEDEPAILQMAKTMLERQGYTVMAANTPKQAIHMALEHPGRINLLITDVVMPEMNGRELVDNLLLNCPDLKYLFMSGYTSNVVAHHGILDEGLHFIQKPFSAKDLSTKVRKALRDGP